MLKMKFSFKCLIFILLFLLSVSSLFAKKKVACIGNSITENVALPLEKRYPSILQDLLGSDFDVRNYGVGARTMLRMGDHPYWNEQKYRDVLNWNPDIVIIKMGTNDAKPYNWKYRDQFEKDYIEFIESFKTLASHPKLFICYPIPTSEGNFLPVSDSLIICDLIPKINQIARQTGSEVIDLHSPLLGKEDFLYDKVHPNEKGTQVMARVVAQAICPDRHFPKPAIERLNVVFLGNSITEGSYLQIPPPVVTVTYLDSLGYDVSYVNCGISGSTTYNFLPSENAFKMVVNKADSINRREGELIFSVKLGTNDSACKGTTGAPVSNVRYKINVQIIIDSLHTRYPASKIIIHYPIWYSPNTYNSAEYMKKGLLRLQTYFSVIDQLEKENSGLVFVGDRRGFDLFRKHSKDYYVPQKGKKGIFYLHPNAFGAKVLGELWAETIDELVRRSK